MSARFDVAGATSAIYAANWAVSDWYLDQVTGDDVNDGTTPATPLATGAELLRRLGPYAIWSQSVTVHVLENGTADAIILRGLMVPDVGFVDVIGVTTIEADGGTLASYLPVDHSIPRHVTISTSLIADFSPHKFRRIRLTSGASIGAIAYLGNASPGGVGAQFVQCAPFANINLASSTLLFSNVTPVVGVDCVIDSVPYVPAIEIDVQGPISASVGPQWPQRKASIQHLDCPLIRASGLMVACNNRFAIFASGIGTTEILGTPLALTTSASKRACHVKFLEPSSPTAIFLAGMYANCLFSAIDMEISKNETAFFNNCLFLERLAITPRSKCYLSGVQFFDVPATHDAILINSQNGSLENVSGDRNGSRGIGIMNASQFTFTGIINILGAGGNGRLQSTPGISPLTYAQLLQPSDYAQKGISAAMVAGVVTVTVPWYENTVQQVTVSHAAFAGTPGILSVQQISNTQFRVTSSSATDTSTVRWAISPLGRNIFINSI